MKQPRSMYFKPIQFLYRLNYRAFIRENIEENDRVAIIEERLALLEQKEQEKSSITDNEVHTNFFVARTCLFLVTVAVILASLLTFGPTFEHSTLNHIF